MAPRKFNLESEWFIFGNEWAPNYDHSTCRTELFHNNHYGSRAYFLYSRTCHWSFSTKNMKIYISYKFLNKTSNERLEIKNVWIKYGIIKGLWLRKFSWSHKNKLICFFELFGQVAEIFVYIFMSVTLGGGGVHSLLYFA